jgi:exoribonuclease-2
MPFYNLNEIKNLLESLACQLIEEKGFIPEFSKESIDEINKLPPREPFEKKDFTDLFWVSIDNIESMDLDQISYCERLDGENYRVYVAIADVDHFIPFDSEVDRIARNNTTTVYTPFKIFPMIPKEYCYDKTSLLANKKREAIVVQMKVVKDGFFFLESIHYGIVENKAKLNYPEVSDYIDYGTPIRNEHLLQEKIESQITLHDEIAKKIHHFRFQSGALLLSPSQGEVVFEDGIPKKIKEKKPSTGQRIIENLMIACNVCVTKFFMNAQLPILRRIVKTPKRWNRIVEIAGKLDWKLPKKPYAKSLQEFLVHMKKKDPDRFPDLSLTIIKLIGRGEYILAMPGEKSIGHFDLALIDYAHTTAPNRRYPDLMMQRILKNELFNQQVRFERSILQNIASNCSFKEDAASKVERQLFKSFAAYLLSEKLHEVFKAIVTGVTDKGTWIRLVDIPVEGKLIEGYENIDVGDSIEAELVHLDIPKGFIDFCKK